MSNFYDILKLLKQIKEELGVDFVDITLGNWPDIGPDELRVKITKPLLKHKRIYQAYEIYTELELSSLQDPSTATALFIEKMKERIIQAEEQLSKEEEQ